VTVSKDKGDFFMYIIFFQRLHQQILIVFYLSFGNCCLFLALFSRLCKFSTDLFHSGPIT